MAAPAPRSPPLPPSPPAAGSCGCFFASFGDGFTYRREVGTGEKAVLKDPEQLTSPTLAASHAARWCDLKNRFGPVSPVCVCVPGPRLAMRCERLSHAALPFSSYVCHRILDLYAESAADGAAPVPPRDDASAAARLAQVATDALAANGLPADFLETAGAHPGGAPRSAAALAAVAGVSLGPSCAVVAGLLANEVLKFVTGKGQPIDNIFVYDPSTGEGKQFRAPAKAKK